MYDNLFAKALEVPETVEISSIFLHRILVVFNQVTLIQSPTRFATVVDEKILGSNIRKDIIY